MAPKAGNLEFFNVMENVFQQIYISRDYCKAELQNDCEKLVSKFSHFCP